MRRIGEKGHDGECRGGTDTFMALIHDHAQDRSTVHFKRAEVKKKDT